MPFPGVLRHKHHSSSSASLSLSHQPSLHGYICYSWTTIRGGLYEFCLPIPSSWPSLSLLLRCFSAGIHFFVTCLIIITRVVLLLPCARLYNILLLFIVAHLLLPLDVRIVRTTRILPRSCSDSLSFWGGGKIPDATRFFQALSISPMIVVHCFTACTLLRRDWAYIITLYTASVWIQRPFLRRQQSTY